MYDKKGVGKTEGHGEKPRLIRLLHKAYSQWAVFVVEYAWVLICVCLLASALGAFKMVNTKRESSIRGYTPYGARALHEFDVRDQFFDQTGTGIRFFVLLLPKDNSTQEKNNLLTEEALKEIVQIDNFIQNNLTIFNRVSGRQESFNQICRKFCTINEPVRQFYNGFKHQKDRLSQGDSLNYHIKLDYPIAEIFGRSMSLQPNFFGVHLREDSNKLIGNEENQQVTTLLGDSTLNETAGISAKLITNMDRVEMIVLLYRAEQIGGWTDTDIKEYEMSVSNYFKKNYVGKNIRVMTISSSYVSVELERAAKTLVPFVGLGLVVMVFCSLVTCTLAALFTGQFSFYRLPLPMIACLCPFMASGTALGILFLFGFRNSSILGVSPFLVLAIGVDDAFLMIHAWNALNRQLGRSRKQALSVEEYVASRLAMVLEETGPAILISALTNILADAVGSFTGSPEITLLCIANIGAIVADFFYQISLFTSVMALCAIYEERALRNESEKSISPAEAPEKNSNTTDSLDESPKTSLLQYSQSMFNEVVDGYVGTITSIPLATVVCLFWAVFIALCFKAMLSFEINLTTRKLFPRDSPLLEIETYREEKILPAYSTAQLFINNPGNLSDPTRRRHLNQLIEEMESLPYAYNDPRSSMFFLRDLESFSAALHQVEEEEEDSDSTDATNKKQVLNLDQDLNTFLDWPDYTHWKSLIKFHEQNSSGNPKIVLDSFMATVAYHGSQLTEWNERAHMLNDWRRVVDKYVNEFNVTVLHDDGLYLDLLNNMTTDIWQSLAGTLVCMAAICILFIHGRASSVFVAVCVIASIMIATMGLMQVQGMSMDPVVMAAVIVSIGFSVDIPTHVAYHLALGVVGSGVQERVKHSFDAVGWPAIQASMCTVICITFLLLAPVYIGIVFVRVMCLCIGLCALHSLVLLPAMFAVVHGLWRKLGSMM